MPNKNKKPFPIQITARDLCIFQFILDFKGVTTAALARYFFPTSTVQGAYRRFWQLSRAGWLEQRTDERGKNWVWTLTEKSFRAIQAELLPLREQGFRLEFLEHDLWVSAFHLGDNLASSLSLVEMYPEQWMRRVHWDYWPHYVSRSLDHRPDGMWYLDREHARLAIALEVERQPKKNSIYQERYWGYRRAREIGQVIWVVRDVFLGKRLAKELYMMESEEESKHSIVLFSDFEDSGWAAKIWKGLDAGHSVRTSLLKEVSESPHEPFHRYLLDGSKTGVKSEGYRKRMDRAQVDCISRSPSDACAIPFPEVSKPSAIEVDFGPSDRSLKSETQPAVETPQGEDPWR